MLKFLKAAWTWLKSEVVQDEPEELPFYVRTGKYGPIYINKATGKIMSHAAVREFLGT